MKFLFAITLAASVAALVIAVPVGPKAEDGGLADRLNLEIVALTDLTTPEQEALLKPLLQAHAEDAGSAKAAAILADWPRWKARFKVLVPPSEKAAVGLAERQVVAA